MKKVIEVGEMKGHPEDPVESGHVNAGEQLKINKIVKVR